MKKPDFREWKHFQWANTSTSGHQTWLEHAGRPKGAYWPNVAMTKKGGGAKTVIMGAPLVNKGHRCSREAPLITKMARFVTEGHKCKLKPIIYNNDIDVFIHLNMTCCFLRSRSSTR